MRSSTYLPEGTDQSTLDLLRQQGAQIVTTGHSYFDASQKAREAVQNDPDACVLALPTCAMLQRLTASFRVLVPTYDDPDLWRGHGSMVTEIAEQLGVKPDAIFCRQATYNKTSSCSTDNNAHHIVSEEAVFSAASFVGANP